MYKKDLTLFEQKEIVYAKHPYQKETNYTSIVEYEKFLQERMELKNRELDFSTISDEKLLDLKDQFTPDSVWNADAWYNLRKVYDEITRRKL